MNHLSGQTSPYLLQHLDNPVDWYPYGKEAFELAKKEDKPILLSVGYSACHWCHVMAHESFEDPATADVMNKHFINVKVDREERPDVDAIYMQAVTSLIGRGGWPMTVFLTPLGDPFYVGTYFPKERKNNMPSFGEVLETVAGSWREQRQDVLERADQVTTALRSAQKLDSGLDPENDGPTKPADLTNLESQLKTELETDGKTEGGATKTSAVSYHQLQLIATLEELRLSHDPAWGGFGRAPKFPQAMALDYLINYMDDDDIAMIVKITLDAMASGGIYDQLGGGFSRYSTDLFWLVPHFEKMLYDNALLIRLYLNAFQRTQKPRYRQIVVECLEYVLRDLSNNQQIGGFYTAEDADSEGEEGLFYVWEYSKFMEVLSDEKYKIDDVGIDDNTMSASANPDSDLPSLAELAKNWYGVNENGNFEGKNILYRRLRGDLIRPPEIQKARELLFNARNQRIRPALDSKVLTEWNGLMVSALCEAGFILREEKWLEAAKTTCEFLYANLRRKDGRWMRSWTNTTAASVSTPNSLKNEDGTTTDTTDQSLPKEATGKAMHLGYAGDYAQIIDAFTRFYSASGSAQGGIWLERAQEVADELLELFWDNEDGTGEGGFFSTGKDTDDVIFRPKDFTDNAMPSANSAAAIALMRLAALTGNETYQSCADQILDLYAPLTYRHPLSFGNFLNALFIREIGIVQIVIPSQKDANGKHSAQPFLDELAKHHLPHVVLAWGETSDLPIWEGKKMGEAYICKDFTCLEPVSNVEDFAQQLSQLSTQMAEFAHPLLASQNL